MSGLYLHIPFCRSRCIYCGFYSTTALELRQQYVDALCHEMLMRPPAEPVKTVYLGGGTPSQLSARQLRQLFMYINKVYGHDAEEVTIEVNPDDVTADYAALLQQLPVNRVSMGVQTFDNGRLRFLHRRHTAGQVAGAVGLLREAGIHNISIDLMYGFPDETLGDWQRDIRQALELNVEHLSAYCLMIEEGTALYERMKGEEVRGEREKGGLTPCDEELERQMYELLTDELEKAGYEHYEISNFARPGYRSRHNTSYWCEVPYIGLGAGAHSFDLRSRQWNVSNIRQYIESIADGKLPCEREVIDEDTRYNDRITVALRTREGLDLDTLTDRHRRYCLKEAQRYIDNGLLRLHGSHLMLTREGLFVSDMVMSELVWV